MHLQTRQRLHTKRLQANEANTQTKRIFVRLEREITQKKLWALLFTYKEKKNNNTLADQDPKYKEVLFR